MKLTPERARELIAKGFKIDPKQIIRAKKVQDEEPVAVTEAPRNDTLVLNSIIAVLNANEQNTKAIADLQRGNQEILNELVKEKPKQSWKFSIERNPKGEMSTVYGTPY